MSTKPTGVGRGGRRPGAGRKPKHGGSQATIERQVAEASQVVAQARREPASIASASELVAKAYATLAAVMDDTRFSAPRVSAARTILELAREEQTIGRGKKAQRQAAAEESASAGIYAVPTRRPRVQ